MAETMDQHRVRTGHSGAMWPIGAEEGWCADENCRAPLRDEGEHEACENTIRELRARIEQLTRERDEWSLALQSLTVGGSEFIDDPAACVTFVREKLDRKHEQLLKHVHARKEAEEEIARLRSSQPDVEALRAIAEEMRRAEERLFNRPTGVVMKRGTLRGWADAIDKASKGEK